MIALSNIAQGSAVFAYYLMNRHDERKAEVSLAAAISAYLGVTEPALFGVNVKYIYPFVAGMIGSGVAGLLSTTFNVQANAIGVGGLPGFMSINAKYMIPFFICMAAAIAVPMLLTFFFHKSKIMTKVEEQELMEANDLSNQAETSSEVTSLTNGTSVALTSPLTGSVKALSEASDQVFAQGIMGQGLLIQPTDGKLVSPVDGQVTVLFPTKHAVGLVSTEGLELLMHIGMDTVNLEGKGFTSHVQQGDMVKVGDPLISFDIDLIEAAGYKTETPVVVTNQDAYNLVFKHDLSGHISRNEDLFVAEKK